MFSPASPSGHTTKQLEKTLHKHTDMFDKILQAIQDSKVTLETKIGEVQAEINLLRADHTKLTDRVSESEAALVSMRPTVDTMRKQLTEVQAELQGLKARAEEAEERSRRNNVRFMGFPEKSEAPNAEIFLEEWLIAEVFKDQVLKFFSVERAHRIPGCPPAQGAPPRPLIARFLNFRDHDLILQLFGTRGSHEV